MKKKLVFLLSVTYILMPQIAHSKVQDPVRLDLFGFFVTPELMINESYITNLFYQPGSKVSSRKTVISPSFEVNTVLGISDIRLLFKNEAGFYSYSPEDDYVDSELHFESSAKLNHRNRLGFGAEYAYLHQERGKGLSEGSSFNLYDGPIKLEKKAYYADYSFGSDFSRGLIVLSMGHAGVRFSNFRDLTKHDDYSINSASALFSLRLGAKTRFLVNVRQAEINYNLDPPQLVGLPDSLDRQSTQVLFGLDWKIANKTNGSLKLGRGNIRFDDQDRQRFSGPSWEVDFSWQPNSHSKFKITSAQEDREPFGDANFIEASEASIGWVNYWSKRFYSSIELIHSNLQYVGSTTERVDRTTSYEISFNYIARRWIDFGFMVKFENNNSKINIFDYERGEIAFDVEVSL